MPGCQNSSSKSLIWLDSSSPRRAPLARPRCLLGRGRAGRCRPLGGRASAEPSALARGDAAFLAAAPRAALLAAAALLVHCRPGAPRRLLLGHPAILVT